jgi:hypothetical protein
MIGKVTLAAANIEVIDPEMPVDLKLPEQRRYELLQAKYGKQINDLCKMDYHFWERGGYDGKLAILTLLEKMNQHKEFGKSQPPLDIEWIINVLKVFRMEELRSEMNKAALWLVSNPERRKKNYRKFLTSWLTRAQQKQEVHYHINDRGEA